MLISFFIMALLSLDHFNQAVSVIDCISDKFMDACVTDQS